MRSCFMNYGEEKGIEGLAPTLLSPLGHGMTFSDQSNVPVERQASLKRRCSQCRGKSHFALGWGE